MNSEYTIQEYIQVVRNGIRPQFKDGKPKKVIIVGAGLAGLAVGYDWIRTEARGTHSGHA
jgi:NADPH-dependent 2,4-dienoyl-CoA reductase/sulfur reductase-like enzyme